MITNEQGGIISKILLIPVGVALMAGFFFLGYYVGKYQSRSFAQNEQRPAPLPEVEPVNPPKQDEFTFYKTLTEKENKTVSIDLKPKPAPEEKRVDKKPVDNESARNKTAAPAQALPKQALAKKETASRLRYTLQLASYQEKEMAEEDVKRMKQRGFAAFVVASAVEGKGTWYRVRLGSFSNKASAEKLQRELRAKESVSAFITIE